MRHRGVFYQVVHAVFGTFRTCRGSLSTSVLERQQTLAGTCGKIPWRDVGFLVASRHRGTICDPKQRCGNSLALSWIACSLILAAPLDGRAADLLMGFNYRTPGQAPNPVVASGRGALASAGILQPHDFAPVPEITLSSGGSFFCHCRFPIFDHRVLIFGCVASAEHRIPAQESPLDDPHRAGFRWQRLEPAM
jgi:hypothetical protein